MYYRLYNNVCECLWLCECTKQHNVCKYVKIPVVVCVHDWMCTRLAPPYIFSVCADVVSRLRVICTFGQPFPDRCTVCGCVVHLTAFKTERENETENTETYSCTAYKGIAYSFIIT